MKNTLNSISKLNVWYYHCFAIILISIAGIYVSRDMTYVALHMDDIAMWNDLTSVSFSSLWTVPSFRYYRPVSYTIMKSIVELIGVNIYLLDYILKGLLILVNVCVYFAAVKLSKSKMIATVLVMCVSFSHLAIYFTTNSFGIMESTCAILAIIILISLFGLLNTSHKKTGIKYYALAVIGYFLIINSHERFTVLLVVFIPAIVFLKVFKNKEKILMLAVPLLVFIGNMIIRYILIGPEFVNGASGTTLMAGFDISVMLHHIVDSIGGMFGIALVPAYIAGVEYQELNYIFKMLVLTVAVLTIIILQFAVVCMARSPKHQRIRALKNIAVFMFFIGALIFAASITFRIESRWLFTPYIGAMLLIAYLFSECKIHFNKCNAKKSLATLSVIIIMFAVATCISEIHHRTYNYRVYFWNQQNHQNQLYVDLIDEIGLEELSAYQSIVVVGGGSQMDVNFLKPYFSKSELTYPLISYQAVEIDKALLSDTSVLYMKWDEVAEQYVEIGET